jgi:putative phosphoesterase
MIRVGLISDTHGLLRPEAIEFLRGCDHIIHGGDIGNAQILEQLARLSAVTAVRGNNDVGAWASAVHETETLALGGILIHALHDLATLDVDPAAAGYRVIVSGHSHKPSIAERGGVLFVNPGSAGPRRFKLPVSVAELSLDVAAVSARIVPLPVA